MKANESINLLIEGLRKAETMLNESELQRPPYLAPLVSLIMLAEASAALAAEVEELKETLIEHRILPE